MTPEQARALFNEHREPGDLAHYGEKAAVAAILKATQIGEVERTMAAGRIIDIMTGGKFDWRNRLEDGDFLESADWLTALAYADASLKTGGGL